MRTETYFMIAAAKEEEEQKIEPKEHISSHTFPPSVDSARLQPYFIYRNPTNPCHTKYTLLNPADENELNDMKNR